MKRFWLVLAGVALAAVLAVGLLQAGGAGSGEEEPPAPARGEAGSRLAGAPPQLGAIHRQSNQLLPGGPGAFRDRLAQLEGHPVVVNKWASWCGPCKAEFPDFQRASVEYGKRVAFLGVNSNDNRGDAERFLEEYPVSFPSYEDPSGTVAQLFNAGAAFPATAFYDRDGELAFVHQGQYLSGDQLERDIRRYALR
jgi:cytochrome c biogenesis protein CcmG, thiol:disulfide interchange protein DsbE